ncbi:hypothetical protein D3C73_1383480 [compost metagenome]
MLRLDPLDQHVPQHVFITGIRNLPLRPLAGNETPAFERNAEPLTERLGIDQGAPYKRAWRLEHDFAFKTVGYWFHTSPPVMNNSRPVRPHVQPESCINQASVVEMAVLASLHWGKFPCYSEPMPCTHAFSWRSRHCC